MILIILVFKIYITILTIFSFSVHTSYRANAHGSLFLPSLPKDFSAFLHSFKASLCPLSLARDLAVSPSSFLGLGLQPGVLKILPHFRMLQFTMWELIGYYAIETLNPYYYFKINVHKCISRQCKYIISILFIYTFKTL